MTSSDFPELRESFLDLSHSVNFLIRSSLRIQLCLVFYSHNLSECHQQNVSLWLWSDSMNQKVF